MERNGREFQNVISGVSAVERYVSIKQGSTVWVGILIHFIDPLYLCINEACD